MATVPDSDIPSVQAEPLPGRAYPRLSDESSPADFGSAIGNALQRTGVRAQEKQTEEAKVAQRQADQVRIAQANTTLASYVTDQLYTNENAAFKKQGSDAVGMDSQYLPKFDDQVSQISEGLANPAQKAAFAEHASYQRGEMGLQLARYEKEAGDRTAQSTYQTAFQTQTSSIGLNWRGVTGDDRQWNESRNNLVLTGEAAADRLKLGKKETTTALVDGAISAVVNNSIADGGWQHGDRFLEAHKGEITNPALYAQLKDRIDAKQKQADAELKDGLKGLEDDAQRGALAGVAGSERLISDGQLKTLHPHDWQLYRNRLNNFAETGAAGKKYDQMSPAEIQTDLDANDPTKKPAHEGQGAEIEAFNMRVAVAQRSIAERQADPRAFALKKYGDQPIDWGAKPEKVAEVINSRAAVAADDSRRTGVNMPLLSKTEAAQFSNGLSKAAPDQQLGMLTQLRDSLRNEPAFKAMMEQVRPNDPVIAEAALRVPRDPESAPLWYNAGFDTSPKVSQDILAGNALLHPTGDMKAEEGKGGLPKGVAMPTDEILRQRFNSDFKLGTFYGNPVAADQTFAAWKSIYAQQIALVGNTSGDLVSNAARYASKSLMPNMASVGGLKVPVPAGMDPGTFPDRINAAVSASLKAHGDDAKLFKGHQIMLEGRLGSGDYVVLGADGQNAATYPGTNLPVRIHLDQQYRRSSPIRPQRPSTREFPARPGAGRNIDTDTPDTPVNSTSPADFSPAEDDR